MYKAIVKLADRNLLVRNIHGNTVVYDAVFTKNDATDMAECVSLGLPVDTQRTPQRFLVQNLDDFAVRCAAVGVYVPGADDTLRSNGFAIAA